MLPNSFAISVLVFLVLSSMNIMLTGYHIPTLCVYCSHPTGGQGTLQNHQERSLYDMFV